jgi:hypothetical protein
MKNGEAAVAAPPWGIRQGLLGRVISVTLLVASLVRSGVFLALHQGDVLLLVGEYLMLAGKATDENRGAINIELLRCTHGAKCFTTDKANFLLLGQQPVFVGQLGKVHGDHVRINILVTVIAMTVIAMTVIMVVMIVTTGGVCRR